MQPMSRLVPGGTEQIGLPVPKVGSACKRLWPPAISIRPGNRPLPRPYLPCRLRCRWARRKGRQLVPPGCAAAEIQWQMLSL